MSEKGKVEKAKELLEKLETTVPDIKGSAVVRTDGMTVVSALSKDTDEKKVGAVAAALLGSSRRAGETLLDGEFHSLHLKLNNGDIFLMGAGKVMLAALTGKEPNVGYILLEMETTTEGLSGIFH
ncbi:MAG: roadblock/LC7 domain-containing protein [Candidatus Hodarchaeota archaeon]